MAREAVLIYEGSHDVNGLGEANVDLAEVLVLDGDAEGATVALERGLDCFRRKGNEVLARRVEERLLEVRTRPDP